MPGKIPLLSMRDVSPIRDLTRLTDLTKDLAGEQFIAYNLRGSIVVMEIVDVEEREVTVRRAKTGRMWRSPNSAYDIFFEALPQDDDTINTITHRIGRGGTLKTNNNAYASPYFIPPKLGDVPLGLNYTPHPHETE